MKRYFLGTDTGSTKSHAIIADETGQALGFGQGGQGNPQGIGFDGLLALLDDLVTQATGQAGITRAQIEGVGFGIAGYDWPSQRQKFMEVVAPLGLGAPIEFANDATVGLLAGSTAGWGVAVVSGTSCNCRGRDRGGREGRVTGYGHLFGEYGGAYELTLKAVQAIVSEWAHRGPTTRLTAAFMTLARAVTLDELVENFTTEKVEVDPEAARIVFQVAAEGDPVAIDIIGWLGCQLGDMANGVIRQLGFQTEEFEVVLVGSLYEGGPLLTQPMRQTIQALAPGARFVRLSAPPVVGGVLLGMEQAGLNGWAVRRSLVESTNAIITRSRLPGARVSSLDETLRVT